MVFNVTFNNISAISWQSVLLVEEARGGIQKKIDFIFYQYMYIKEISYIKFAKVVSSNLAHGEMHSIQHMW
jgi:hypothetical protein